MNQDIKEGSDHKEIPTINLWPCDGVLVCFNYK